MATFDTTFSRQHNDEDSIYSSDESEWSDEEGDEYLARVLAADNYLQSKQIPRCPVRWHGVKALQRSTAKYGTKYEKYSKIASIKKSQLAFCCSCHSFESMLVVGVA